VYQLHAYNTKTQNKLLSIYQKKIPTNITPNAIEIPESPWNWFREINKKIYMTSLFLLSPLDEVIGEGEVCVSVWSLFPVAFWT
jgi:hypothetical protein